MCCDTSFPYPCNTLCVHVFVNWLWIFKWNRKRGQGNIFKDPTGNCMGNQLQQCKLDGILAGNQLPFSKFFLRLASFMLTDFMKFHPGQCWSAQSWHLNIYTNFCHFSDWYTPHWNLLWMTGHSCYASVWFSLWHNAVYQDCCVPGWTKNTTKKIQLLYNKLQHNNKTNWLMHFDQYHPWSVGHIFNSLDHLNSLGSIQPLRWASGYSTRNNWKSS